MGGIARQGERVGKSEARGKEGRRRMARGERRRKKRGRRQREDIMLSLWY